MKIPRLLLLLSLLVCTVLCCAPVSEQAQSRSAAFSEQRLGRIGPFFERYLEKDKLPGVITLVAHRGEVVHFQTSGFADLESRTPLQDDSIFRIYSMTKPIVGAALMTLFEEGRFQLSDPVSRYIPEFQGLKVDSAPDDGQLTLEDPVRGMTIRDLMTHTSGLTYGFFSQSDVDTLYQESNVLDQAGTLKDMIEKLAGLPLRQQPGSLFHYSVSVDVQGYLIEVLSGQSLDIFLKERIFDPLRMTDTGFYVPQEKLSRLTTVYGPPRDGETQIRVVDHPSQSPYTRPPTFLSGGGGLVSTASDYLRFCRMLLNRGELEGVRIVAPRTVDLMTRNHLPEAVRERGPDVGTGFGLNFAVVDDPVRTGTLGSRGEYFWGGLASTIFWIDPEQEVIAILLTQFIPSGTYPLREQFRTLVYQALIDPGVR